MGVGVGVDVSLGVKDGDALVDGQLSAKTTTTNPLLSPARPRATTPAPPPPPPHHQSPPLTCTASVDDTRTTSSMNCSLSTLGLNPAPMPWIWWYPGLPPDSTGLSSGSTATN